MTLLKVQKYINKELFSMETLDDMDLHILRILQENSNLTTKELAAKVHLSSTPVFERLKRLEREGYIKKYVAILDPKKLDRGFMVFCSVKLKQLNTQVAKEFTEAIIKIPEVTACYNISGDFDYLLKIYASSMKSYQEFLINKLGQLESLGSLQSVFVMDEIKQSYSFPI